ncbi:MAG: radical SAM family heme chaperone HemW [Ignavibacteria bacterium]|nr:radical SAM family heme chaperone HemW [Ignavibacteria bacterium]
MSGIYLHIPFCETKCIYCDFYSVTGDTLREKFITSLLNEIKLSSDELKNKKFDTIFFGGGTPSLLTVSELSQIFNQLFKSLNISSDSEVTIECNPGTVSKQKLYDIKKLPVNRLSFGIQSFSDKELRFLTRIHNSQEAERSVIEAQEAGFSNINIDLISSLPGQTLNTWKYNLEKALSLNIQHISAYTLTYEKGTPLYKMKTTGRIRPESEETESMHYRFTSDFLTDSGFEHYEISNFALPGFRCRHNLKYWNSEEYVGFGPSASSYLNKTRFANVKSITKYIDKISKGEKAVDFMEFIDEKTSLNEYIFLRLRSSGLDFKRFRSKFGFDFRNKFNKPIEELTQKGYAKISENEFKLTISGYSLCDEITVKYFYQ